MSAVASLGIPAGKLGHGVGARLPFKLFDHLRAAKQHNTETRSQNRATKTDQKPKNEPEDARTGPGKERQRKEPARPAMDKAETGHRDRTDQFTFRFKSVGSWVGAL